jgi:hypothetical protein
VRRIAAVALLALTTCALAPAQAETLLSPAVGAAFGGATDDSKITYCGALTFKSAHGVVGFAVDFGYTPDFLGSSGFGNNNVATLMGNLVLMAPGPLRLYGSLGLGIVKTRVEDVTGFFKVDSNELGFNAGGGFIWFPGNRSVGIQGDLRYFRNLTDPERDNEFDVDLGGLSFWRATGGLTFRF